MPEAQRRAGKTRAPGASACLFKCQRLLSRPGSPEPDLQSRLPLRCLLLARTERELPPRGTKAASYSSF